MFPRRLFVFLLFMPCLVSGEVTLQALDLAPVKRWLEQQDGMTSLSSDFVQTRAYRSLRDPLKVNGRLWFRAPDWFRWELGDPPKTVVLRQDDSVYMIRPAKKRAARFAIEDIQQQAGPAMFEFPIARSFEDFKARFRVDSIAVDGGRCDVAVSPKEAKLQKFLSRLAFGFDTQSGHLLSIKLTMRDGSFLQNEFSNVRINPRIEKALFAYDLTGFKVTDERP